MYSQCSKEYPSIEVIGQDELCGYFQQQIDYWNSQPNDFSEQIYIQDNFPPVTCVISSHDNSSDEYSSNHLFSSLVEHSTPHVEVTPITEIPSDDQSAQDIKKRKDAKDLPQNLSSKTKSLVSKVLSRQRPKDWKKTIKDAYNKFLKENSVTNSQIVLVFAYLFIVSYKATENVYSEFKHEFLKHLHLKYEEALKSEDQGIRKSLLVKIKANIDLIQYVFDLKGQEDIDFNHMKIICEGLFTGRQANRIKEPIEKAKKIQDSLRATGQVSPRLAFPSYRETSNTSTGCQVEL